MWVFCVGALSGFAYESPGAPNGYINDYANILSESEEVLLEAQVAVIKENTQAEVTVVTIDSLAGEVIEQYAVKLFEEWGIGEKGLDNGVLLLIAHTDRAVRIEVGYGLEAQLPDSFVGTIIANELLPEFATGDYYTGTKKALDAIAGAITGETPVEIETNNSLLAGGLLTGMSVLILLGMGRMPCMVITFGSMTVAGMYVYGNIQSFGGALLAAGLVGMLLIVICAIFSKGGSSGNSGFSSRGGRASTTTYGGSSSKPPSFGGGRSGGGGASGRW
jgi:uncharacterized protein